MAISRDYVLVRVLVDPALDAVGERSQLLFLVRVLRYYLLLMLSCQLTSCCSCPRRNLHTWIDFVGLTIPACLSAVSAAPHSKQVRLSCWCCCILFYSCTSIHISPIVSHLHTAMSTHYRQHSIVLFICPYRYNRIHAGCPYIEQVLLLVHTLLTCVFISHQLLLSYAR